MPDVPSIRRGISTLNPLARATGRDGSHFHRWCLGFPRGFGMIRRVLKLRSIVKNRRRTPSELELLRQKKLQAVIRNAYDHVQYYRSLFRSVGLSPDDIRTPEDLQHVPITTKDDLRAAGTENVTARWADLATCITTRTHGSSGKPFTVYRTASEHTTLPMLNMASLMAIGFRPRDRLAVLGPDSVKPPGLQHRMGLYRREHIPLSTLSLIHI